jgi:ribonuclease P protein component
LLFKKFTKKEVDCLFKTGRWQKAEKFNLVYKRNNLILNRLIISISSKKIKKSSKRNRIKRIVRELVRSTFRKKGYDIAFIYVNKGKEEEIKQDIKLLLSKIK